MFDLDLLIQVGLIPDKNRLCGRICAKQLIPVTFEAFQGCAPRKIANDQGAGCTSEVIGVIACEAFTARKIPEQ